MGGFRPLIPAGRPAALRPPALQYTFRIAPS